MKSNIIIVLPCLDLWLSSYLSKQTIMIVIIVSVFDCAGN